MAASLSGFFLAGGLLCAAAPASAQEFLSDPTRPAIEMSPAASGASAASGMAGAAAQPVPQAGLQSVIISPQHRAAVINGQTVELGGKVGDATLLEVRESSVVLDSAQGKRVMELFPGVHIVKTEAQVPAVVKPARAKFAKHRIKNKKKSGAANSGGKQDERESK